MNAAVVQEFGVPRCAEFEDPEPGDGHAVVDVIAAGLNNVDAVTARGGLPNGPVPPFVAGREGVGLLGARRVYFDGPVAPFGSMADRALVDPAKVYDVPDGLSDGLALAIGIAGLAGWVSLSWRAALRPGETVLVLGASGVVGQTAIQAARLQGAGRFVAAARSASGQELARRLGADAVVALGDDEEAVGTDLKDAAGDGADVVVDLLGGPFPGITLPVCSRHARYVQVGNLAGPVFSLRAPLVREGMVDLLGYTTRYAPPELVREAYGAMADFALKGDLVVEVEEVALADIEAAWQRLASPGHRKIVLRT